MINKIRTFYKSTIVETTLKFDFNLKGKILFTYAAVDFQYKMRYVSPRSCLKT